MSSAQTGQKWLRRVLAAVLAFVFTIALSTWADDRVAPLPQGVKAVWSLDKAARESTPTRERVSINGLWHWQPDSPGATQPPVDGWGHFKAPAPCPGISDSMQHDAQALFVHPRWKDVKLAERTAAWYQREITISPGWTGRRIALSVDYLNLLATVFVDGRPAGELRFLGGELDFASLGLAPGTHELSPLVDALPLRGVMLSYTDSASARQVKGSVTRRGLCGDAFRVSTPATARIDDVRVETPFQHSLIAFDTALLDLDPTASYEYGAPFTWDWTMYRGWYKGQRSFGSARVPWEFCSAEWNAQFLGDRAYRIAEMEKKNLRWEVRRFRAGELWHRWNYPFEVGSKVFDDRHEVIGRYLADGPGLRP